MTSSTRRLNAGILCHEHVHGGTSVCREETEFVRASLELRTAALSGDKEPAVDLVCLPTALPLPQR